MAIQLSVLSYKDDVDHALDQALTSYAKSTPTLSWTDDAVARIREFAHSGKTIRGSLVLYVYRMFKSETLPGIAQSAAAVELVHAGLLIHDDIMDRDTLRHGKESLYVQYIKVAKEAAAKHPEHFGDSQAINLGDLCYFLAFSLIDSSSSFVSGVLAQELSRVALAQMQDVSAGELPSPLTRDQVLSVYVYKTARYSFSLPMRIGAMLAHAPDPVIRSLDQIGEHMGILYQIRDDELSVSGDPSITGKPSGSDQKNGKQTLASFLSAPEMARLKQEHEDTAKRLIQSLPLWGDQKAGLTELLAFCTGREK